MNKVAAIIVTHNRKDKLVRCISSILDQEGDVRPDILVVDNNSSDGTDLLFEYTRPADGYPVAATFTPDGVSTILYCNTGYNSGGAGGFCYGIRQAVRLGYDYVWLTDDDGMMAPDALAELMRFESEHHGEYGFLAGRVLWTDGSQAIMNTPRQTLTQDLGSVVTSAARIAMSSFVSLFIPTRVVKEVGLPMRKFFIWTDDWEYTRRISRRYPCWLVPSSTAVHETPMNAGADIAAAQDGSLERFRYLYRNDVYLYRREGLKGLAYETARLGWHLARIALSSHDARSKLKRAGILIRGTADGLRFFPAPEMPDEGEAQ